MNNCTNIKSILRVNPEIEDSEITKHAINNTEGIGCFITVTKKIHQFVNGKREARVIYITPYRYIDFLVSIKRFLFGVRFENLANDGENITEYVLGTLPKETNNYAIGRAETAQAIRQGRRLVIAIENARPEFTLLIS